ncbi:MAG: flippase-like domain-containing protein [Anaerolineales bacterium]|nr:flippase-like domain-containing protein [Anaerolineales bacterium]
MKRWQFWLGVAISAVFLWLALRGLRLDEVWEALKEANYLWLIPGVTVYFFGVWARTWRWHYLLRPIKKIPILKLFPIVTIGYFGNNIYPARAGELLRAFILRQTDEVPVSTSLATIIIERAFDGIVMLSFVFINLHELASLTSDSGFIGNIRTLTLLGAAAFFIAVLIFFVMAIFPERSKIFTQMLINRFIPPRFRPAIESFTDRFLVGLVSLRSPFDVLMVLITSIVIWLFETWKYWFVMHAFDFQVSFFALMLMNGIVNLATTLPSAPGYFGTFDAPGIAVLVAYGVPQEIATGYTFVLHAALWLPITILGAYYMAKSQLSWRSVQQELAEERAT